ncbi:hypothetical protein [Halobacterium litoreum]|uniref:Uncharacterized protein n=1 Tax=Halobacterium litoreum TaxID=2039234 RepID=A0ABD5ND05_9EURY|nr:hypothetical protein [Halobacterium litoreum]UHH13943.1 hypothetical protein LT972_02835 [Halobacterium litoreum]
MTVTFRLELRSTETRPSAETQESVLPALSQKFGQRVNVHAAELTDADRLRAATIGTVAVDTSDDLGAVYEYVKPHNLVKVGTVETDGGHVFTRKSHEVDRRQLQRRPDAAIVAEVRGDLLVHVGEQSD